MRPFVSGITGQLPSELPGVEGGEELLCTKGELLGNQYSRVLERNRRGVFALARRVTCELDS